ncbi:hypothetical protein KJ763_00155 [Patescibacteria group bacterium]|nr:hypothetical protein [Patescibacteria group bacterium]
MSILIESLAKTGGLVFAVSGVLLIARHFIGKHDKATIARAQAKIIKKKK